MLSHRALMDTIIVLHFAALQRYHADETNFSVNPRLASIISPMASIQSYQCQQGHET